MRKVLFAICLFYAASCMAQSHQDAHDSLSVANEALEQHPDSVDLILKKARWNLELEQWQYARDEYDKILRTNPGNIAALYYRAFVNEKQLRYSFARLDYENLLKAVPGNFEAQLGLALLNQKDQHYTEAYDQINRLVNQFPHNATAYAARAGMEQERSMLELSEYDYGKAIEYAPDNKDYILNRADVRIKLHKTDEAREDLEKLIKMGTVRGSLKEYFDRCAKNK